MRRKGGSLAKKLRSTALRRGQKRLGAVFFSKEAKGDLNKRGGRFKDGRGRKRRRRGGGLWEHSCIKPLKKGALSTSFGH